MPLVGGCHWPCGLKECSLSEDFFTCNRLWPPRVSMICPLSEDFVRCNGLCPPRVSEICPLSEDFVSCNGLRPPRVPMNCSSLEDFVLCNGLQPPRVSMICPLSEDFVSCNGLWPWRATMICPSSEDFVSYQWRTSTTMGHRIQTGASRRNSGADKASGECITLMKVKDFLLDTWSMLGWSLREAEDKGLNQRVCGPVPTMIHSKVLVGLRA